MDLGEKDRMSDFEMIYWKTLLVSGKWPHQESNLEQSFRKAPLYPFNYEASREIDHFLYTRASGPAKIDFYELITNCDSFTFGSRLT
jgi:hypothetical protein